jgi:AcrR family transcriptional regulator
MARIVNKEEYEMRRNEILDAAQRLVYTRGIEQVSIQDILTELHISKGAFYHYFNSRQALLEALIERLSGQIVQVLSPIVQDEDLPAVQKLQRLFDAAARWKTDRKEYLLTLVSAWYADNNAILRQKVQADVIPQITPLISSVIHQGIREGVFHTNFPEQVSGIIFSLLQNFGDALIKLILQPERIAEALGQLETVSASHQDAVERILGAASGSLPLFDLTILREWFPLPNPSKE